MKSLLIIRHAKSSWDSDVLSDFDRPLNERGKMEAPAMAEKLLKKGINIDHFVSSPAKRAKKTAKYFIREFGKNENEIELVSSLYNASPSVFFQVVSQLDDAYGTVAIFSHNPGITEFTNLLSTAKIDDMPTCAIFAVKVDIDSWKKFADAKKDFWFFNYPKSEMEF